MLKFKEVEKKEPTDLQRFTVRRARVLIGHVFSYETKKTTCRRKTSWNEAYVSYTTVVEVRWGAEYADGKRVYGWTWPQNGFDSRLDAARWLVL